MPKSDIVHGLWIGGELSPIEILCIKSYLHQGYLFYLWTYNEVRFVPTGVIKKNASEIIPSEYVFSYSKANSFGHGNGSFAGFSDIFRYKLLYDLGGIWTDMDICLIDAKKIPNNEYFFRKHNKLDAVGNFMKCPKNSEVMKYCYERANKEVTKENSNWMLPIEILNQGIDKYALKEFILSTGHEDSWPVVSQFFYKKPKEIRNLILIHWMNEELRRLEISKNYALKNSYLFDLLVTHNIDFRPASFLESIRYSVKISRLFYLYKVLIGKLKTFLL